MEDIATEILKPIARVALAICRLLFWLAWELMIQTIGWSIGWILCRTVSLGNFPKQGILDPDSATLLTAFIVELIGIASLITTIVILNLYISS